MTCQVCHGDYGAFIKDGLCFSCTADRLAQALLKLGRYQELLGKVRSAIEDEDMPALDGLYEQIEKTLAAPPP